MMEKILAEILSEIKDIKSTLGEHTQILKEHTQILGEHTKILGEHTQLLRALEHSSQVNKAEHDNMSLDIAEIKGEVKAIRKDLSAVEVITANNWSDLAKIKAVK